MAHGSKPLTCVQKVPVSKFGRDTGYFMDVYRGFISWSFQESAGSLSHLGYLGHQRYTQRAKTTYIFYISSYMFRILEKSDRDV